MKQNIKLYVYTIIFPDGNNQAHLNPFFILGDFPGNVR